jgi:hypothetical protein
MLFHLLSILDLLAAGVMVGGHFGLWRVPLLYVALYLAGKLVFWRDALSVIDAIVAVYLVFVFFGHPSVLTWVFLAYFLYKISNWFFMSFGN